MQTLTIFFTLLRQHVYATQCMCKYNKAGICPHSSKKYLETLAAFLTSKKIYRQITQKEKNLLLSWKYKKVKISSKNCEVNEITYIKVTPLVPASVVRSCCTTAREHFLPLLASFELVTHFALPFQRRRIWLSKWEWERNTMSQPRLKSDTWAIWQFSRNQTIITVNSPCSVLYSI